MPANRPAVTGSPERGVAPSALQNAIYCMPYFSADGVIDRRPLRVDVHARIRDAIVTGALAPGAQIKDVELASALGVSRTPVREALLRLAETGLVELRAGRSTVVAPLDARTVREARDVVAAMHRLAVQEGVGALGSRQLAAMRAANDRFRAAISAGDVRAALLADDELHRIPVQAAGNRVVTAVLEQLTPVLHRAELLRFASVEGHASADRHDELIRACAAGDAEAAAAVAYETWHSLPDGTAPAASASDAAPTTPITTTKE